MEYIKKYPYSTDLEENHGTDEGNAALAAGRYGPGKRRKTAPLKGGENDAGSRRVAAAGEDA